MRSYYSFCALMNYDVNCEEYVRRYGNQAGTSGVPAGARAPLEGTPLTLKEAIEKGLKEEAHHAAAELSKTREPLDIINTYLVPALDNVGKGFEKGSIFLPQLLMSADAARIAFSVLKDVLAKKGGRAARKEKIILATVKGDIHDIGKNIVKVLLENYGYEVIDLGKDVPPEAVVEAAVKDHVLVVGLSALMTTTVPSMAATIDALRAAKLPCRIMVGGAVLTADYAARIGADHYAKDAKGSVDIARQVFGA